MADLQDVTRPFRASNGKRHGQSTDRSALGAAAKVRTADVRAPETQGHGVSLVRKGVSEACACEFWTRAST